MAAEVGLGGNGGAMGGVLAVAGAADTAAIVSADFVRVTSIVMSPS